MKLNRIEFALMNNPIRAIIQETHEIGVLRKMTSITDVGNALEIGCGNGHGTKLIKKYFCPRRIDAVDLDEKMSFPDHAFDAIFDFGMIHHIPNWKDCISEMKRVLKDEGELILEELSIDSFVNLSGRLWRKLLDHPYDEMFSTAEFLDALAATGFVLKGYFESYPLWLFKDFSLVAKKAMAHNEAARSIRLPDNLT